MQTLCFPAMSPKKRQADNAPQPASCGKALKGPVSYFMTRHIDIDLNFRVRAVETSKTKLPRKLRKKLPRERGKTSRTELPRSL